MVCNNCELKENNYESSQDFGLIRFNIDFFLISFQNFPVFHPVYY